MSSECRICRTPLLFGHVCNACIDNAKWGADPENRTHAAIGRAVEKMPIGCGVYHGHDGKWYADKPGTILQPEGPTPLDALRAAGLVEEEK